MSRSYLSLFIMALGAGFFLAAGSRTGKDMGKATVTDTIAPAFLKARDHKGKSMVSTSGVITFTTGLENDYYQPDSANKIISFYLEARLAKLLNAPEKRTPLNISIVIDRSGSMQGVKMGYAKKAAKSIIDHLEPTDYVSVVMYDNAIDSVQEPVAVTNKELIKSKIDRITARGSTNLWGGTEKGYDYVRKNYKPGYINRVLLISDGLANVGLTDSLKIRKNVLNFKDNDGITLSTFGVGLDYNESLMTDMAESGAGNYYFIDAPDHMISLFDQELNAMLRVIAQNAEFRIKLPPGARVQKCYPLPYTQIGDVVIVKLRDLFAEETKATLLTVSLDNKINNPLTFHSTLSYTDIMDGLQKSVSNQNNLLPVKRPEAFLTHFNKPVVEQAIFYTANENLEQAMEKVDRGDFEGARKLLDANRAYLRVNSYYVKGNRELRLTDSVNARYDLASARAQKMTPDSLKKLQKSSKAINYELRNKKY